MVLSVSLGGKTFKLEISSDGPPPCIVSVEQFNLTVSDGGEPDTAVKLRNFSGTLFISRSNSEQALPGSGDSALGAGNQHYESMECDSKGEKVGRSPLVQPNTIQKLRGKEEEEKISLDENYEKIDYITADIDDRSPFASNSASIDSYDTLLRHHSPEASIYDKDDYQNNEEVDEKNDESDQKETISNVANLKNKPIGIFGLKAMVGKKYRHFRPPTRLHALCQQHGVKIETISNALESHPSHASYRDKSRKLPLHIIAQNESFIFRYKHKDVNNFMQNLIHIFPSAVSTTDNNGRIPFTNAIHDWIQDVYASHSTDKMSILTTQVSFAMFESTLEGALPTDVTVTSFVRWSFCMLSEVIEKASIVVSSDFGSMTEHSIVKTSSEQVLDNIATLPNLFPTILLIEDGMYRRQLLNLPVIQRILLRKELVDKWLVVMLASGGNLAAKAIDYFEVLSNLDPNNAFGVYTKLCHRIHKN